jgi:hypothetical protein
MSISSLLGAALVVLFAATSGLAKETGFANHGLSMDTFVFLEVSGKIAKRDCAASESSPDKIPCLVQPGGSATTY